MSPRIRDQSLENYRPTFAISVMTSELHVSVIPEELRARETLHRGQKHTKKKTSQCLSCEKS
jgi:hypothetical protein